MGIAPYMFTKVGSGPLTITLFDAYCNMFNTFTNVGLFCPDTVIRTLVYQNTHLADLPNTGQSAWGDCMSGLHTVAM